MSDARTRELERRALLGDHEAQVRLLRARVRAGDLPIERLRLAAYLGHAPSREALGEEALPPADLQAWIRGLAAHPDSVLAGVRAAVVAAERVLPLWEAERPNDDRPRLLIAATVAWIRHPCFDHARAARGRLSSRIASEAQEQVLAAIRLAAGAAEVAQSPSASAPRRSVFYAAAACSLAAGLVGEVHLRSAIGRALAPWALGLETD